MEYAWIDLGDGRKVYRRVDKPTESRRGNFPAPMVIGDNIELQSQVDGKMYTSKAALRKSYRENGYIEVGNEELKPKEKPKPDRKAIRDAAGKALNRVGISV